MKNICPFLFFPLLLSLSTQLSAQTLRPSQGSFIEMQKALDEFRSTNNLDSVKGWKWQARWLDYLSQRSNPDGSMADPNILMQEAVAVSALKKTSKSKSVSNWSPVGPDFLYPSNFADRQHGMGRINCITFHPSDSNIFWVGVAQGGVWKTLDGGQNWLPLTDDLPILRISDIAVDPTNTDVIYISVGDYAYIGAGLFTDDRKRNTHFGLGVYKTTDGGQNWSPTGLTFNQLQVDGSLTRRVLIDPNNTQNLVAGGVSGIYTSSNGGTSWTLKHDSLIWDLIQDPVNPNVIYAASGYVASLDMGTAGIIKSTDFGQTWTVLNTGIPGKNAVQRIKLAISPQDPTHIYALACGMDRGFYGLYFSADAGINWNLQSSSSNSPNILSWSNGNASGGQGTYDLCLLVDPTDKLRIITGGINVWGSEDAGVNWKGVSYWLGFYGPSIHADHHFFAYNPLNQAYYVCHDGGLSKTYQVGFETWANINNGSTWPTVWEDLSDMQITAYYRIGLSKVFPGYLVAGAQDNSTTYKTPSSWLNVIGGDGMDCALSSVDPDVIYGSSQFGNFYRSDDGGQNFNYISDQIFNAGDEGGWTTPIILDEDVPTNVYLGYGDLWKSTNSGNTWTVLSNFPDMPTTSVAPPISDFDIDFPNNNALYVASRLYFSRNTLSKFWVSTDGGTNWNNRTSGLPDSLFFTSVECASGTSNDVYVAMGGFEAGKKVYKTSDNGQTWQNISGNLPNVPVNVIVHQENSSVNTIYAGTDIGVYYINDTLATWQLFSTNLPNVIVSDLKIDYINEKIYASTFGRGIWVSDLATSPSTSLADRKNLNYLNIKVFPNPSTGHFEISFENESEIEIELEIVNIMGRSIRESIIPIGSKEYSFKEDNLEYGLYFIRFKRNNASIVKKILVSP